MGLRAAIDELLGKRPKDDTVSRSELYRSLLRREYATRNGTNPIMTASQRAKFSPEYVAKMVTDQLWEDMMSRKD